MKTDFYTKAILTIIAICLLSIVLRENALIGAAHAQSQAHVVVDSASAYALQFAGPLHVICDSGCK
jgi:hypothetical protein